MTETTEMYTAKAGPVALLTCACAPNRPLLWAVGQGRAQNGVGVRVELDLTGKGEHRVQCPFCGARYEVREQR